MKPSEHITSVRQVQVQATRAGQRLDNFLQHAYGGLPRGLIYRIIRTGQVRVNGKRAKPMQKLVEGDEVRLPPVKQTNDVPVRISSELVSLVKNAVLYQDEYQLVIDKPAGLAVHAGSGLNYGLIDVMQKIWPNHSELALVHRLDRDTSGCLLAGFDRRALLAQQQAFKSRQVSKRYLTLLCGRPKEQHFEVDLPLMKSAQSHRSRTIVDDAGKSALTRFKVLEQYQEYALVEAEPVTGRTHQIRVHAASIGLPVAGDQLYQMGSAVKSQHKTGLTRMFLHAHYLQLNWPQDIFVNAPLPDTLRGFLDQLN